MTGIALADVMRFADVMLRFQEVQRRIRLPRRNALPENDAEHSYQLAMMAWYIILKAELTLDLDRVLQYILVHDLPEVYSGDRHALDHAGRMGKSEREGAALRRLLGEFPELTPIIDMVRCYEAHADDESRFVYALDKLLAALHVYMEGGSTWHDLDYGMAELLAHNSAKTVGFTLVHEINRELEELIRQRPSLFPRP